MIGDTTLEPVCFAGATFHEGCTAVKTIVQESLSLEQATFHGDVSVTESLSASLAYSMSGAVGSGLLALIIFVLGRRTTHGASLTAPRPVIPTRRRDVLVFVLEKTE